MLDNRILTFLKLCEKMNYTKTAEALHITQPAVTQHIRYLEEHYGCRLFSYTGKLLKLTEKGELLRRLASEMVANEIGIQKEMARTEEEEIHLRIGATKTIGEFVFPSVMSGFLRENPQHRLHLHVDNTKNLLHMLEKGDLDFTIGSFPSVQEISNFIAIKELVKANLGITFSYYPMFKQELEEGSLVQLEIEDFEIYREFNYVYMKNSLFEEKYKKLIDFAKEVGE